MNKNSGYKCESDAGVFFLPGTTPLHMDFSGISQKECSVAELMREISIEAKKLNVCASKEISLDLTDQEGDDDFS